MEEEERRSRRTGKKGGKVVTLRGEAAVSERFKMIKSRNDEDEVKTRLINSSPSRL